MMIVARAEIHFIRVSAKLKLRISVELVVKVLLISILVIKLGNPLRFNTLNNSTLSAKKVEVSNK
jgi:hypothetical protein